MPTTKSAKKALRQNLKRRKRNLQKKKKIKNLLKEVKILLSQQKIEKAKELLPQIYKVLDKAVKTGLLKERTAARKKSKITKLINSAADKS